MQKSHRTIIAAIVALQIVACIGAAAVHAEDSRQKNKNLWRNATIASGAVALYGLAKHKDTLTIAGAAGALYSAKRYEDDRHSQSQASANAREHSRAYYYHGNGQHYAHRENGRHFGWHGHHRGHDHEGRDCR